MTGARLEQDAFTAMGTECAVALTAGRYDVAYAQRAFAAARREIETCELVLSRFRPDSDLSRLNGARGEWVEVDVRLVEALRSALDARDETGGSYDPTILPVLEAAGYDRSFEQLDGRRPAIVIRWRPNALVEVDATRLRARVEAGAAVDLGGIGKGFAAARTLVAMRAAWPGLPGALVDLGGDIVVSGETPEGGPWRLAVADPRDPGATLATIALREGAVATSGRDGRRFGPGQRFHHLINPVTGAPAAGGPLAATVVGTDAVEVEAYATALAITPPVRASALLGARPDLSALLVPAEGRAIVVGDVPLVREIQLAEVIA